MPWDTVSRRKPYVAPRRNYRRIENEDIRREIESGFNEIKDALSFAYYREWRYGRSHPVADFDVKSTIEETEHQYQLLNQLRQHLYIQAFHAENISRAVDRRVEEARYNKTFASDDGLNTTETRLELAARRITEIESELGKKLVIPASTRIEADFA